MRKEIAQKSELTVRTIRAIHRLARPIARVYGNMRNANVISDKIAIRKRFTVEIISKSVIGYSIRGMQSRRCLIVVNNLATLTREEAIEETM